MIRIALDAMGTDDCPAPDIEGGVLAARELGVKVVLVGDEAQIRPILAQHQTEGLPIEVRHAPQTVIMTDKPSDILRGKPQSSMHIGLAMLKAGEVDAFVSMGNTGAALSVAMLGGLGRIRGIKRPALSAVFPIFGRPVIFTDIGANADVKPELMLQFALMGAIYAKNALGTDNPRVGLLSNGEEEGKGNELIHQTSDLMRRTSLNFIGNVEPKEVFTSGADVVVSDGFTGNILVKTYEAAMRYVTSNLRDTIKTKPLWTLGGALIRPAMGELRKKLDTSEVGGAPLLGVDGVVIIGHGSSDGRAIRNAIHQATLAVNGNIVNVIRERLPELSALAPE
jgi:glycerol-3-phosphate acyltransferase PlsX